MGLGGMLSSTVKSLQSNLIENITPETVSACARRYHTWRQGDGSVRAEG